MNAEEMLRRAEIRQRWSRFGGILITALVCIGLVSLGVHFIYQRGIAEGVSREQTKQVRVALQNNADQLRVVRAHNDSLRTVDHAASAIAARAGSAAAAHRPVVDRAASAVQVSGNVGDSLVVLERPAGGADGRRLDSLTTLPLPVATFIREAKVQLGLDSIALHEYSVSSGIKDQRIATLERADSLNQQRDSLHVEREHQLERNVKSEGKRGFWRGVKAGVIGTAVVVGTLVIVF